MKEGKTGMAVVCVSVCVVNAHVSVSVTKGLISGNRPGRDQGGEQEEDVEGGWKRGGVGRQQCSVTGG